jgi:ADP-ribosylglycohydrolase
MMAGMILGAHGGMAAIPEHWLSDMNSYENIRQLLESIDLGRS